MEELGVLFLWGGDESLTSDAWYKMGPITPFFATVGSNLLISHLRKAGGNHRRRIGIGDMLPVRRAHDLKLTVTANTTENRRNLPQKERKLYSKHPFLPKCEFQGRITSNAWYKMGPQKPVRKVGRKSLH